MAKPNEITPIDLSIHERVYAWMEEHAYESVLGPVDAKPAENLGVRPFSFTHTQNGASQLRSWHITESKARKRKKQDEAAIERALRGWPAPVQEQINQMNRALLDVGHHYMRILEDHYHVRAYDPTRGDADYDELHPDVRELVDTFQYFWNPYDPHHAWDEVLSQGRSASVVLSEIGERLEETHRIGTDLLLKHAPKEPKPDQIPDDYPLAVALCSGSRGLYFKRAPDWRDKRITGSLRGEYMGGGAIKEASFGPGCMFPFRLPGEPELQETADGLRALFDVKEVISLQYGEESYQVSGGSYHTSHRIGLYVTKARRAFLIQYDAKEMSIQLRGLLWQGVGITEQRLRDLVNATRGLHDRMR